MKKIIQLALAALALNHAPALYAAVTAEEAAALKTTLTPVGAEKAGNKEGTIPAWTGEVAAKGKAGNRADPFAADKPVYSITAKNMAQYADKLTEGTKAMLQKYPESFRLDVYPTRRTFVAPQWFYTKTLDNAVKVKLSPSGAANIPEGAAGGIPFPIPKSGEEVMANYQASYRPEYMHEVARNYTVGTDGRAVMVSHYENYFSYPYSAQQTGADERPYWMKVRSSNLGPAIRAGESIITHNNLDETKTRTWVYLTGQRRVRKLPNSCCDTPTPFSAGILNFDELSTFEGDRSRFDWKLVGKKEILIPYNSNRVMTPASTDQVIKGRHLNPDHVRWELHRVWVVEATLKDGRRHTSPKSRYYVDEDSWIAVLGDRWDAQGKLARMTWQLPVFMPEVPAVIRGSFGMYDLVNGTAYFGSLFNNEKEPLRFGKTFPASTFAPESMASEGIR